MDNSKSSKLAYWLILILLIVFSFLNFSERFYPLLNSDHAVSILMTPGFSIPADLYFWGQNRNGSLVPMLANFLYDIYRFPPVLAVSVVHYLILILGFFAMSTLFRNRNLRLLAAVVWFFPSWHFLDQVVNLYGLQISMVAIALWFLNLLGKNEKEWKGWLFLSAAWASFIVSIWVSDLSILTLLILLGILLWRFWPVIRRKNGIVSMLKDRRTLINVGITAAWFLAGAAFIWYAKRHAHKIDFYNQHLLNHPGEIWGAIKIAAISLFRVFTFSSENFVESIYAWIMLTGIPVLVWRSGIKIFSLDTYRKNPSLTFFLLNGILLLGVMFLSNWVYVNGVGRRYFSIVYVFLWMAFLLLLDTEWPLQKRSEAVGARSRKTDLFQLALIFMILIGGFSSFDKFYFPKRIPPRIDVLSDFQRLGNIGIIGEYWNSYLIAAVDPVHIKATPYDKDMVRNRELAREVFRQPKMYIVRDGWLDSFPDTLMQFDHYILKKGEEVRLGDCYICRYAPDLLFMQFTWREMQHQGTVEDDSLASGKQSIRIGAGFDRKKHFIYGPFIKLDPGMISVTFRLKAADCLSTNNIAVLDVTANYGKKTLASKTLRACDFEKANYYQDFEIPMELDSTYHGLEFRVLYLGPADLWFDKVFIKGRI